MTTVSVSMCVFRSTWYEVGRGLCFSFWTHKAAKRERKYKISYKELIDAESLPLHLLLMLYCLLPPDGIKFTWSKTCFRALINMSVLPIWQIYSSEWWITWLRVVYTQHCMDVLSQHLRNAQACLLGEKWLTCLRCGHSPKLFSASLFTDKRLQDLLWVLLCFF